MNNLEFEKPYTLEQLVKLLADGAKAASDFCVYTGDYELTGTPSLICYLAGYPEIDDDDEELYPAFVRENNLELFFYGDQLEDVVRNALTQKENASASEIIDGINWYIKSDTFIDLA